MQRVGFLLLFSVLFYVSCVSSPHERTPKETPIGIKDPPNTTAGRSGGLSEEIRQLVERGNPTSLLRALDIIRSRDLGESEFGRAMNGVIVTILKRVYPDIGGDFPPIDPPLTSGYTKILRDIERNAYVPAAATSTDFIELVVPFLAYLQETRLERLAVAEPDLMRASQLFPSSALVPLFWGIIEERRNNTSEAMRKYRQAYELASDCYPAAVSLAKLLAKEGGYQEALVLLQESLTRYPDSRTIKRQMALVYYQSRNWSRAEMAVAELLQRDTKDTELLLIRSHALVEQGKYSQAAAALDAYATFDTTNPLYLYLRARLQMEGYQNRDAALTYLRSLVKAYPDNVEGLSYFVRLLLGSSRQEERNEGQALLSQLMSMGSLSPPILELVVQNAISREAWSEALTYGEMLLKARGSPSDRMLLYQVYKGLRDYPRALSIAQDLFQAFPESDDTILLYVDALILSGKRDLAQTLIDQRLIQVPAGARRSQYFYMRSLLRADEEQALNDLRSSLFEDPRNINALISMLEIYDRRKDERRALYYYKQAVALNPDHPRLQKYKKQYGSL
ncbi:MAG TPA: tetratricopeptide repeat protein [Termitinemataceae bacterium]|nr:tetratricopeptide repeat protein [Termitinemataceae bacterium]HPQ00028.1 tetratricopeptide repeat protein [Termitinemataceae bacterium]